MKLLFGVEKGGFALHVDVSASDLALLSAKDKARVHAIAEGTKGQHPVDVVHAVRKIVGIVAQTLAAVPAKGSTVPPHDITGVGGIESNEAVGGIK